MTRPPDKAHVLVVGWIGDGGECHWREGVTDQLVEQLAAEASEEPGAEA